MPRRVLARGLTAAATTVVLGAGLAPAVYADTGANSTAKAAPRAAEPETVVPAGSRFAPTREVLFSAGDSGYLSTNEAGTTRWVDEATGAQGAPVTGAGQTNGGLRAGQSGTAVTVTDLATGTAAATVQVPAGQQFTGVFRSDAVVTDGTGTDGTDGLHILRTAADGTTTDQAVTGTPAGALDYSRVAQSTDFAVFHVKVDGTVRTYLLSYADASVREIFASVPDPTGYRTVIGGTRVLISQPGGSTAYSVRLDDPAGTVETTPFPALLGAPPMIPVPVGDRVLFLREGSDLGPKVPGLPLLSVPVGGGAAQTLLTASEQFYAIAPDGSVLVVGGTDSDDWAVRKVTAASGADPVLTTVRALPPVPAVIYGMTYTAGQLLYSTNVVEPSTLVSREVGTGATPTVGAATQPWNAAAVPTIRNCGPTTAPCVPLTGLGTGTAATPAPGRDGVQAPVPGQSNVIRDVDTGATDNVVSDASDGHTLITSPSQGKQWVADLGLGYTGQIEVSRTTSAAALWGNIFWVPGTAGKGSVRPYNLTNRTFGSTFQTAATCASFTELQADDRWLYWSCGSTAGVYDWKTGKNIPVPAGTDTLLGDGYLVRHDKSRGKLVLTDFHSGTAVTGDVADLAAGNYTDDRGVTWSVDKYGGGVAYVDATRHIHVLPLADIVPQNINLLRSQVSGASVGSTVTPFTGQWDYSRPTGPWTLAVKNAAGTVVATRTGTARNGTNVTASWDLKTASGSYTGAGTYSWTFTVQPRDGQGPWLSEYGTLNVTKG
ncbi:hypothetical protein [Streptomyces sp. CA-111067]|uniref:hypothetical protein n=1 Tax=Streptomyces sp. CA-111067 TaxID=3240046 RepID=UPI003D96B7BE